MTHRLLITILSVGVLSTLANAQDGIYGYTSVEFDTDTNTVTGYTETDLDVNLQDYYEARVVGNLYDNGTSVANQTYLDTQGQGYAAVVLQVAGNPGDTYNMSGFHMGYGYQYDCAGTCVYYDPDNFTYFEDLGIYACCEYDFFGPGPQQQRSNPDLHLGTTYDSAQLTTPVACGDQRDQLIAEYKSYTVALHPVCSSFTQTASTANFTFAALDMPSPSQPTPTYSWALLRSPMMSAASAGYGLDDWVQNYGSSRTINSGFRCPSQNSNAGGAHNSRHMYGDAVDLQDVSRSVSEWLAMSNAAKTAGADYIEPQSGPCGLGCTHADWRSHAGGYVQ